MLSKLIALTMTLSSFSSFAEDLNFKKVSALLPKGSSIAQVKLLEAQGYTTDVIQETVANFFVIRDLNGDKFDDVLVISEKDPKVTANETQYGKRSINLYLGKSDGSFILSFSNKKYVLAADEGGVFGDPLEGLSVLGNGVISLSFYGGSNDKWSYSDKFQFLKGDLYVIGQDRAFTSMSGSPFFQSYSANLLTGDVVKTSQKTPESKEIVKKTKLAKLPALIKLSNYKGQLSQD